MATLQQVRRGLQDAWDNVVEGWQGLYHRASNAITQFTPGKKDRGDETGSGRDVSLRNAGWGVLAAEVFDDNDKVVVRLETPGLEKTDFEVEVRDNYLVVRGEKRVERESSAGHYHITECAYGCFERAIPLPEEVDSSRAEAKYRNGVLRIELPRTSSVRKRAIRVDVN